jgi:hypothetical protein
MNTQIRILEIILAELIGERDLKEMEFNKTLNDSTNTPTDVKNILMNQLSALSHCNRQIELLTDYVTQIRNQIDVNNTPPQENVNQPMTSGDNNNNTQ